MINFVIFWLLFLGTELQQDKQFKMANFFKALANITNYTMLISASHYLNIDL